MFSVVFFQTETGNEPVRDWLRSLSARERAVIGADLRTVQIGFPLGMPLCRPLGNALYEVRSSLPSKREARLIFFQDAELLVIVCGFIKQTRATPESELKSARKRQAEYKKNKTKLK
jgi:phage-related protein